MTNPEYETVLHFWFDEIDTLMHFKKDLEFDEMLQNRFSVLHKAASRCELYDWRNHPDGRLAEIIILDQFSRNMYRDDPKSFAYDKMALLLAQEMVRCGDDQIIDKSRRSFVYMPYMHSESLIIHNQAVHLFQKLGNQNNLDFEYKHKAIIEQFGRYPHRNQILGRASTPAELQFLHQRGSGF